MEKNSAGNFRPAAPSFSAHRMARNCQCKGGAPMVGSILRPFAPASAGPPYALVEYLFAFLGKVRNFAAGDEGSIGVFLG